MHACVCADLFVYHASPPPHTHTHTNTIKQSTDQSTSQRVDSHEPTFQHTSLPQVAALRRLLFNLPPRLVATRAAPLLYLPPEVTC